MINRLGTEFPGHVIVAEDSRTLYVVDYKNINAGNVEISITDPGYPHVFISNENEVPIFFDGFPENAFVISPGIHCKQCECIIFPQTCLPEDWLLAIETKYSVSVENAFRLQNDYPRGTVTKIIDNINYLRNCGVIEADKRVSAIVCFPGLIADFSGFFLSGDISVENILIDHKIKIRITSQATIKSSKRIII